MKIQKLPNGRYRARVWDGRKAQEVSKVFKLKAEAEAWQTQMETARSVGSLTSPRLGRVTLTEWWEHYIAEAGHLSPASISSYSGAMKNNVLPHLGRYRISDLTHQECQTWAAKLRKDGKSAGTIHLAYRVLRAVLEAAVKENRIARNPARDLKLKVTDRGPEDMRILTAEELERLAEAVGVIDSRYRALVLFMGWTGLRIGEASALRVKNLELDEPHRRGRVRVVEAVSVVRGRPHLGPTKTGQNRVVTLPGFLVTEMVTHLEQFGVKDGLVFGGPKGGYLNRHNFYNRAWRPGLELAGLEDPQPRVHDLRHTAVSLSIRAGAHPKEIQARAGHSSIRITMDRYGHLFPGQDEALAERLDTLRPAGGFGIISAQKQSAGQVVPLHRASDQGK